MGNHSPEEVGRRGGNDAREGLPPRNHHSLEEIRSWGEGDDWRRSYWEPKSRGRDPKLTKYDGKIPWWAYEVKLQLIARQYDWDNETKLTKLVEALEDKALTFFSGLTP